MASNASLRKSNEELASQLEELSANHAILIEENARIICQMDGMKDKLAKEKAMSTGLKSELEVAALKV